jgi:hypothetical protein
VSAGAHASRVPAVVVIVCLPLTVSKAVLHAGLVLNKIDPQGAALIGFAGKDGGSRRTVLTGVYLTDAAGKRASAGATWKVR